MFDLIEGIIGKILKEDISNLKDGLEKFWYKINALDWQFEPSEKKQLKILHLESFLSSKGNKALFYKVVFWFGFKAKKDPLELYNFLDKEIGSEGTQQIIEQKMIIPYITRTLKRTQLKIEQNKVLYLGEEIFNYQNYFNYSQILDEKHCYYYGFDIEFVKYLLDEFLEKVKKKKLIIGDVEWGEPVFIDEFLYKGTYLENITLKKWEEFGEEILEETLVGILFVIQNKDKKTFYKNILLVQYLWMSIDCKFLTFFTNTKYITLGKGDDQWLLFKDSSIIVYKGKNLPGFGITPQINIQKLLNVQTIENTGKWYYYIGEKGIGIIYGIKEIKTQSWFGKLFGGNKEKEENINVTLQIQKTPYNNIMIGNKEWGESLMQGKLYEMSEQGFFECINDFIGIQRIINLGKLANMQIRWNGKEYIYSKLIPEEMIKGFLISIGGNGEGSIKEGLNSLIL